MNPIFDFIIYAEQLKMIFKPHYYLKKKKIAIKVNTGVVSGGESRSNLSSLKEFIFLHCIQLSNLNRKDSSSTDGRISEDPTEPRRVGSGRRVSVALNPPAFHEPF